MIKILPLIIILLSSPLFAQFVNVRVSSENSYDPEEVTIAINPLNPDILAAGANINYFFISTDGGMTWDQQRLSSSLGVWGDPSVVFDDSGYIYFAHLSNPLEGYWIDRIVVQRSTDYGKTWNDGAGVGFRFPRNQDKEWLAVDLTNSPYRGNIYMSWTEFDDYGSSDPKMRSRILFSYSSDRGITWSEPMVISDKSGNCIDSDNTAEGAVPAVGPNGEIYIAWALNDSIYFDKSTDGGKTFGPDKVISDQPGGWDFDIPGINRSNGFPVTACDVSRSPYRGTIYVITSDQRNGADDTDIFLVKSTDGGDTWSEPLRVNKDLKTRHQFFTWMTVDSSNGYIYVSYYDRRNTVGVDTDFYIARSTDGGKTFQEFKVSESFFTPNRGVFFGDYTCIAAYKGKIYPIWMRMDGNNLSVWTAIISDSSLITSVKKEPNTIPGNFIVYQNYPNPFNPATTIPFNLKEPGAVKIQIYDLLGRELKSRTMYYINPGLKEFTVDLNDFSSGTYIYKVTTGKSFGSKKFILLK